MYAQSLMMAPTARGVASCPKGALGHYAGVVRDQLGAPDDLLMLFGIAFCYEQAVHRANVTRTVRAALAETIIFQH